MPLRFDSQSGQLIRQRADEVVSSEPGLFVAPGQSYENWLEATGRDDSFVGDGISIPGTADLYDAALRAAPHHMGEGEVFDEVGDFEP